MQSTAIRPILDLIAAGQLDTALRQTTRLLNDGHHVDLQHQAHNIEGEYARLRQQVVAGTLSREQEVLETNRITARLQQLLRQVSDPVHPPAHTASVQGWRYVFAGAVVALAIGALIWRWWGGASGSDVTESGCPVFGADKTRRVLVLPFKQTGTDKKEQREFDLSDQLNDAFRKDEALLRTAESDVHEAYDISANYPNPSEAMAIGRDCGVSMIVWGKMRASDDTIEVRYKLLDPARAVINTSVDTAVNRLLAMSDEGVLIHDVPTVARLLYLIMASQYGSTQQIASTLDGLGHIATAADTHVTDEGPPLDTSTMFVLADAYRRLSDAKAAIKVYDEVLTAYPDNSKALRLRGTLSYQRKDYATAAHDYEALSPDPARTEPTLQMMRADAYIKSGQPDKAKKDLDQLQKKSPANDKWLKMKQKEVADSTSALQARVKRMEQLAARQPHNVSARLSAAQANLGLGKEDSAIKNARQVLQTDPKNTKAFEVATEAYIRKGDTTQARQLIRQAAGKGVQIKVPILPKLQQ
jgi:tetratricopeptide (TPR) repeat protein/ribosomal protein L29